MGVGVALTFRMQPEIKFQHVASPGTGTIAKEAV
jgi:hypothetical protein